MSAEPTPQQKEQHVVDMRSDTVTKPTEAMRTAMFEAQVGDDVFMDDPTVTLLEEKAAAMLGKEGALFVPSGTMGNLISVMVHCSRRGDEVLIGDKCHISKYEQGGIASLGGVHSRQVKNLPDGTLDLNDLRSKIMPDDVHAPASRLVCIENTHNLMGGRVIRPEYMEQLIKVAKDNHLKIHVDGARIFNAATALGIPVSSLLEEVDSVSCCLSKGLGAPVGSVIAGSKQFIKAARRLRKALGGGMRQVGVLAAPGIIALEQMSLRLQTDHDHAKQLALGIAGMKHLGVEVDPDQVETNLVYFGVSHPNLSGPQLIEKLAAAEGSEVVVKVLPVDEKYIRAVIHHQITRQDVELCLSKIEQILLSA